MRAPAEVRFVRFEAPEPNARGAHVGIFALANGLAGSGRLAPDEWAWWRTSNDWYDAAYTDPAVVDPDLFDRAQHPVTACWFRSSATHLLARIPGYLALLEHHGIACVERRSDDPGRVLYADDVQIVVACHPAGAAAEINPGRWAGDKPR